MLLGAGKEAARTHSALGCFGLAAVPRLEGQDAQLVPALALALLPPEQETEDGDFGSSENSRRRGQTDCPSFFLNTTSVLWAYVEKI